MQIINYTIFNCFIAQFSNDCIISKYFNPILILHICIYIHELIYVILKLITISSYFIENTICRSRAMNISRHMHQASLNNRRITKEELNTNKSLEMYLTKIYK